jgi:phosphoribosyl 1,2-cyclic phosphate phosphodiesterase
MVITFLGTGTSQGVPVITCSCAVCSSLDYRDKRLRVSVHIQHQSQSFIIDTGPDFRQQVLREKIQSLDAILLSHEHKDHTAGLDDVRAYNFKQQKAMPVYGMARVLEQVKQEFHYAFAEEKYPGIPQIQLQNIENEAFNIGNIKIEPVKVWHHKLEIFGYKIGDFAYITDANHIEKPELEKLKNLDILVLNALQQSSHISHYTLQEALDVIAQLKPKQAYLTHLSHKMGLHSDIESILPPNVQLAYDGLKIKMEKK